MTKRWLGGVLAGLLVLAGCGHRDTTSALSGPPSFATSTTVTTAMATETSVPTTTTTTVTASVETTVTTTKATATTVKRVSPPLTTTRRRPTATKVTTKPMTTTYVAPTARPEVTVTVPEGYAFMQIANLLEQKGVCSAAAFYKTCQSYTPQSFTIPISNDRCFRMEGYLFPDTYRFYKNDDPQTVLIKMLNNYRARVGTLDDKTLILASIVEREARSSTHMKLVASVFTNRLQDTSGKFNLLGADPTREYVNRFITGNPLVANQGKYPALYNTCGKRIGLPAGPICNPGLRAIEAAKNPTKTDYFYFFYGKDYENHYSKTLEEHNEQMKKYGVETGE